MAVPAKRRILIVEDEFIVGMLLEDLLLGIGHDVVACLSRIPEATEFAQEADFDFAILDVNLRGVQSTPVARTLRRRGIPFVFATGYGSAELPREFDQHKVLRKPYQPAEVLQAVAQAGA